MANAHAGVYGPVLTLFTVEPTAGQQTLAEICIALNIASNGFLQAYLMIGANDHTITIHIVSCYPA